MIGALLLLGIPAFALFKKHRNPHWTPFSTLFATPRDLNAALERVRITSVPTPALTSALDPGMSSEQVKAVNVMLTSETDQAKISNEAKHAKALGFHNTSKALDAKASAVGHAKAKGATDDDIHKEQLAAQTSQGASAAATHAAGWDGYGIEHHRHHGAEWGQQQSLPHHHRHRQQQEQEDLGGDDEEIDPRMLRLLMRMMQQQQQHPHHRHHHHAQQQQFGGDFGFEETPMPRHHFETRGPIAHPHGAFQVPPHGGGGGGGGGGHHGFGHGGFGHGGFGHGGFGYGGLGYEVDPYLYYPPMDMDMGDDMLFDDDSMFLDDGGF